MYVPFRFTTLRGSQGVYSATDQWCSQRGSNPRFRREGAASLPLDYGSVWSARAASFRQPQPPTICRMYLASHASTSAWRCCMQSGCPASHHNYQECITMKPIAVLATQRLDALPLFTGPCWSALPPIFHASPTKVLGTPLIITVHLNPSPGVVSGNRIVLLSRGQPKIISSHYRFRTAHSEGPCKGLTQTALVLEPCTWGREDGVTTHAYTAFPRPLFLLLLPHPAYWSASRLNYHTQKFF